MPVEADILVGNAVRELLLIVVSRDAGERRHCPLTFQKGVEVSFSQQHHRQFYGLSRLNSNKIFCSVFVIFEVNTVAEQ